MAFLILILTSGLSLIPGAHAETADEKVLQQALAQTQDLLTDPSKREQAIGSDPKAQAADAQLKSLTQSPELTAQSYAVAAEILETLMKRNQANPDKMQSALEEAVKNPAAFLEALPDAQKKKIRDIATQIEKNSAKP